MSIQSQFILSIAVCYVIIIPAFKALRDIIAFRFSCSIFDKLPKWIKDYLTDSNPNAAWASLDGWHQSDGGVCMVPLILVWYWANRLSLHWPWEWAIVGYFMTGVLFYIAFHLDFHYLFMKKEHWGK